MYEGRLLSQVVNYLQKKGISQRRSLGDALQPAGKPLDTAATTGHQQYGSMKKAETSDETLRVLGQGRYTRQSTGRGKQVFTMSSSVSRATQIAYHVETSAVTCTHGNSDSSPFLQSISGTLALELEGLATQWTIN